MIRHAFLLAGEEASLLIGGLTQLDRLLLSLEELATGHPDVSEDLQVWVMWRPCAARPHRSGGPSSRSCRLQVGDVILNEASRPDQEHYEWPRAVQGESLVIGSNLLIGRHSLAECVSLAIHPEAGRTTPVRVVQAEATNQLLTEPATAWQRLSAEIPTRLEGPCAKLGFCALLDGAADVSSAEAAFFGSLAKQSDGLASRYINRPISTRVSRVLSRFPVTPNGITTTLSMVLLMGAWLLTRGTSQGFILGTLAYHLVSVLDGCDGEIARSKFLDTRFGAWFDSITDAAGHHLFAAALGVGLVRQTGLSPEWRWFYGVEATATVIAMVVTYGAVAHYTRQRGNQGHFSNFGSSLVNESRVTRGRSLLLVLVQLTRRDFYNLLFVFLALFGQSGLILHGLALGVTGHLIVPFIAGRWSRVPPNARSETPLGPEI